MPAEEREKFIGTGPIRLSSEQPAGEQWPEGSRSLERALQRLDVHGAARLVHRDRGPPVAALQLADGRWLSVDPGMGPPPWEWPIFAFWMGLVTLCVAGLAIFAVMRATRPLVLLERAIEAVGPDGDFVDLPEKGPSEVRATARAINLLSGRLRSAMESRMRLVAAAGHDLRTPLTRMRLRAEFLPEDDRSSWLTDLEELDRIADSAIRLVREEVDSDALAIVRLDHLAQDVATELKEIGLPVTLDRLQPARANVRPLAMKRALRNLTVNAATHGLGAALSVEEAWGHAVLTIADEGPGIPPKLLERAFEPFFRIDPGRKATVPGAGLGLAIAREIVVRNGGTLSIANRGSGGLMQTVSLPLASPGPIK
ncbi:ATP-binding protein [Hansschlegelia quercus]|uniref:ATP-binding protein n=1 Tax=Hansschlegelia quercus TaxID=2528245 RepID=UPI001FE0B447|nr:ATP-binding protein [Hansschlegelia quercus]